MKTKSLFKQVFVLLVASAVTVSAWAQPCNSPHDIVSMPVNLPCFSYAPVAGVNYGCSSQTHYDYYAFKVCGSGTMNMELTANTGSDIDMVMYGPFAAPTGNCASLTLGNIVGCGTTTTNALTVGIPSVIAGNYYVMAVYSGYSNTLLFDFTGTAIVDSSCVPLPPAPCGIAAPIDYICLGSVDSATQKYKVVWGETPSIQTSAYVIMKLNIFNALQPLDTVPIGNSSEYIDMGSNPAIHTEQYYIARMDSCGNTYLDYMPTEPLHLNTSTNQLNQVALSWNNYICYPNPVINYIIYRGSSPGLEVPIDTVPAFVVAYMDLSPPAGTNYYKIAATVSMSCVPMRASGKHAFSNNTFVSILAMGDQQLSGSMISVYPNPASDVLNIIINGHTLNEIEIWDASGRLTHAVKNLESSSFTMDVSQTSRGYYILHVKTTDGKFARLPFIKN
ncbi:MAG: T9SS type A sorting domain-containing protein [Flavobacteriales bacterium]